MHHRHNCAKSQSHRQPQITADLVHAAMQPIGVSALGLTLERSNARDCERSPCMHNAHMRAVRVNGTFTAAYGRRHLHEHHTPCRYNICKTISSPRENLKNWLTCFALFRLTIIRRTLMQMVVDHFRVEIT